jgi:hypothetical protein
MLHVRPITDSTGGSPLDQRVTIPEGTTNLTQLIDTVLRQVSSASGIEVAHAYGDVSALVADVAVTNAVARDVLASAFASSRWADSAVIDRAPLLTWRLNFDFDLNVYLFNVENVVVDVLTPTGAVVPTKALR